ncbi:MAG TPA: acyltransferase [Allosphingosinicella sp.]|jgi:peptidoglycan/LPS O-acetylase OafA/YrhL
MTSANPRAADEKRLFHTLDGLRGIAALAVVARHLPDSTLGALVPSSHLAVDLFFALSGFVLAHAYQARLAGPLGVPAFLRIRLIRLYPLYLLGTLIGTVPIVASQLFGLGTDTVGALYASLLLGLLFLPAPGPLSSNGTNLYPFDFPAWSLWWEMLVNVLYALVAPRLTDRLLIAILGCGATLLAFSAWRFGGLATGADMATWAGGGQRVVYGFFVGVAVYRLWRSGRFSAFTIPSWLAAAIVLGVFAFRPGAAALYDVLVALVVFPLLILAATREPGDRLKPACLRLGVASYALYVLHVPVLRLTDWVMGRLGHPLASFGWPGSLAFIAAVLACALLADRLYDAPLRRWLGKRGKPALPAALPVVPTPI